MSLSLALTVFCIGAPGEAAPTRIVPSGAPGASDLPAVADVAGIRGSIALTQGTVVRRSKLYITLGPENPIYSVLYLNVKNWPIEDPTSYMNLCSRGRPCVPNPFRQPACATDDLATQDRGTFFRALTYPVRKLPGGGVVVGDLARTKVNLVAFGSIPATATLTLRSPRVDGRIEPLKIMVWQTQLSCAPDRARADTWVGGRIEIGLSDLKVDGVPVPLGDRCQTERPARLSLFGDDGYTPGRGGNLSGYDGFHEGTMKPLAGAYYYEDQGLSIPASSGIDIPSFKNCGVGRDDLSRLVTAMAAGPNNPIRVAQSQLFTRNDLADPPGVLSDIDLNDLEACDSSKPEGTPERCPGDSVFVPRDAPERPPIPDEN